MVGDSVKSYRDLRVWQRGIELAAEVYRISKNWSKDEIYGLISQARRSDASVPANIAEGYGRQSTASYSHHLKIARGSLMEMETHLILAERVAAAATGSCANTLEQADELGRMLSALIRSVERKGADR